MPASSLPPRRLVASMGCKLLLRLPSVLGLVPSSFATLKTKCFSLTYGARRECTRSPGDFRPYLPIRLTRLGQSRQA
eukprot:scaffold17878_cov34-Tisochrysis_lutea.AAC.1